MVPPRVGNGFDRVNAVGFGGWERQSTGNTLWEVVILGEDSGMCESAMARLNCRVVKTICGIPGIPECR